MEVKMEVKKKTEKITTPAEPADFTCHHPSRSSLVLLTPDDASGRWTSRHGSQEEMRTFKFIPAEPADFTCRARQVAQLLPLVASGDPDANVPTPRCPCRISSSTPDPAMHSRSVKYRCQCRPDKNVQAPTLRPANALHGALTQTPHAVVRLQLWAGSMLRAGGTGSMCAAWLLACSPRERAFSASHPITTGQKPFWDLVEIEVRAPTIVYKFSTCCRIVGGLIDAKEVWRMILSLLSACVGSIIRCCCLHHPRAPAHVPAPDARITRCRDTYAMPAPPAPDSQHARAARVTKVHRHLQALLPPRHVSPMYTLVLLRGTQMYRNRSEFQSAQTRIPVRLFPLVDVAELMHRWPVEAFAAAIDERTRPVYVEVIMHMDLSMVDNGHEGALRGVWFVLPVQQAPSTQPRSSAGAAGPQHVSHTRACKFVFTKPLRQRMRAADSGPTWAADRGARAQTAAPRALQRAHRGRSRQTAAADRGSRRRAHTKCTLVPASAPAHAQQPPAHHDPHAVHAGAGMRTRVRRSFALAHTHDPQVHMGRRSCTLVPAPVACTCTADAHMRRTGPRTRRTEHGQARTRTAYGARTADSAPKRAADRVPTQIVRAQDCAPVPTRAVDVRRSGQCTPRGQGVHVRGGQRVHARGGQRMARRAQRTARTAYSAPTRAATDVPTYGTPMVDGAARACTRTADRGTRTGAADMARTGAADSAPTGACPRAWRTARRSTYWMPTKLRPGIALRFARSCRIGVLRGLNVDSTCGEFILGCRAQWRSLLVGPSTPVNVPDTAPALVGETDRRWLCIPGLARKCVDVKIEGIADLNDRKFRTSATIRALEGRTGYLLLEKAILERSLDSQKIDVYAVGKNGTKHGLAPKCLRPVRQTDSGTPITQVLVRVIIIGPDLDGDAEMLGCYTQTEPERRCITQIGDPKTLRPG
ncbi:hypothetical protein GGX14DRAFT_397278 [Mycena pura]|uniref:Uncharacterized protein n=1 Tax=Mycena pura TaxID=153505 RepID=A0AAD6V8S3_9AGAR|nr:hypothetical protein GGX14DRAFT_397278 [Mycena pura]